MKGTMQVYTTLTEDTNLSIKLMNMTDQVVANLCNGKSGIGVFEQAFNLSGIADGTYYVNSTLAINIIPKY